MNIWVEATVATRTADVGVLLILLMIIMVHGATVRGRALWAMIIVTFGTMLGARMRLPDLVIEFNSESI